MKYTMSNDGTKRVSVNVPLRLTKGQLRHIAYVIDKRDPESDETPKLRMPKREEIIEAVHDGYMTEFWGAEYSEEFWDNYDDETDKLACPTKSDEE